jgi:hypothetical protein
MRGTEQVPDLDRYLSSAKPAFPNIITLAHTTDPRVPLNPPKPTKSRRQIVYKILSKRCVKTDGSLELVVDVGANFGWLDVLAARLGCRWGARF